LRELGGETSQVVSAFNGAGLTLLHVACFQGSLECVRVLLETGRANAHGQAKVCKSTPLHLAALSGNAELVKLLLQYQTKVNQQNSAGKSALHFAAVGGHLEIIRILLSAGACLETRDSQGRNAHDYAVEKGQKAAAEALETRVARKATDAEPEEDGIMLTFEKLETQEIEAKAKRDEAYNNMRKNFDKVRMGQDHKDGGGRGIWVPLDDNKRNKAGKPPAVRGGRGGAGLLDEDKKNADRPRRNGRLNSDPLDSPGQVKDLGGEDDEDSGSQSPLDFKEFMEKQFEAIIGMESIKNMLRSLCRKVAVDQRRAKFGFQNEQNLNMLFLGAAGTGKTSMARVVAKILRHLGILEKGHLVEVCRKDLVAEYSGQSAARTVAKVKEALGGVLFIDEAYSLKHEEGKDSFGLEVVDTLVSEMENNRRRLVVIMAGYTKEMADFMRSNSGLESRFPHSFEFPNYSYSEMAQIFRVMAKSRKLQVAVEEDKLVDLISTCIPRSVAGKGNARAVRNLLDKVLSRQTDRVADSGTSSMSSLLTLVENDFPTSSSSGDSREEGTSENGGSSPGSLEEILRQLDEIVGVVEVKQIFRSLRAKVTIAAERRSLGLPADGASSLHMIFQGNPGTGKTTVARLMGKMFKAVQMIHSGHLVEVSRVDLVGQHVGETAPKTRRVVESAMGGVLFVDEAYSLVSDSKDSFGREALDTIMKCMEDMRDELVVVLAGYPKEMQTLLETNPGLRSRFPVTVNFPDYSASELVEIADKMLAARQCQLSEEARKRLVHLCEAQVDLNDPMSGNARFVRNLLEIACMRQAERLLKLPKRTREQLMTLEGEDFSAFTEKEFEGVSYLFIASFLSPTPLPPPPSILPPSSLLSKSAGSFTKLSLPPAPDGQVLSGTGVLLAEEVKRGTGGSDSTREE